MGKSELQKATRREFLRTAALGSGAVVLAGSRLLSVFASPPATRPNRPGGLVPRGEAWAGGGPKSVPWSVVLAPENEPGERLVLSGTVYAADGKTPVEGITVYAYHTDSRGLYGSEGRRGMPPRLRGWARTNSTGRYEFHTIKPAPYPNRRNPAHVHMTISSPDIPEWWIPTLYFEGDPLLTEREFVEAAAEGRFGNIRPLARDERGVWLCVREIRL